MNTSAQAVGFISGALTIGYVVAAAFFLKFWRRTRDSLFASFAAAFVLMAVGQVAPLAFGIPDEKVASVYLLRLAAFLVIIWAVLRKNLRSGS